MPSVERLLQELAFGWVVLCENSGMKDVLTRIEFDSANINAERNSSGSVTLTRFDLRGSSLLVRATGKFGTIHCSQIS